MPNLIPSTRRGLTDHAGARPTATSTSALAEPSDLGPIRVLPLIPDEIRRKNHVLVPGDHRFAQAARFLQSLHRRESGLPIGSVTDGNGKTRKLGSCISAKAGRLGANFLDPELLPIISHALIYREIGALYDLERLRCNLLSSIPLAFNTFGLLQRDLALATRALAELLPGRIAEVTHVRFETSPLGRGNPRSTGDNSAYDVAFVGRTTTGGTIYVGIELKYSEGCREPLPRFSGRYDEIAPRCGLFIDPADPALRTNPIQQLYREFCLSYTVHEQRLADEVVTLLVAPDQNYLAQDAGAAFNRQLKDPLAGPVTFEVRTLESVFAALATAGHREHARKLHHRYTDWSRVDRELMPPVGPLPDNAGPHRRARRRGGAQVIDQASSRPAA